MFHSGCVKLLYIGFLIAGITGTLTTQSPLDELLEHLDMHIPDKDHDLKKELHGSYLTNLKDVGSSSILLVHDIQGNLHESTYHYLGLKLHEMYELITNFLSNNNIRERSDEASSKDLLYIAHRNLMRHTLGYLTLQFYMTLMYKSRQDVLTRLDLHHPTKTMRDIMQHLNARSNFDRQFNTMIARVRTLLSEQMIYSEKSYYWNSNISPDEAEELSKLSRSDIVGIFNVQRFQNAMSENLENFEKLLKAKRKFYLNHILPEDVSGKKRLSEKEEDNNTLTGVEQNSE